MKAAVGTLVVCTFGVLYFTQEADAVCCTGKSLAQCRPDGNRGTAATNLCGDCSIGTPYCAYGKCNIFGCACKNGCRNGGCSGGGCGRGRRSLDFLLNPSSATEPSRVIENADLDNDGKVSLEEAKSSLRVVGSNRTISQEFHRLDRNKDGFLTAEEIDSN